MTKATAAELVRKHRADSIRHKIDVFDWLAEKQDKRVAKSPAGYLVSSIAKDYADPKGFVSRAERQRREEERQAKERESTERSCREKEQEARERAEQQAVTAYWESLTPGQQAELDAAATARADPAEVEQEWGVLKRIGRRLRRDRYIRQMLANQAMPPVEA